MGYVSHRVDPNEIKPGDHIYTWRTAFTYAHHGIYVGGNKVIHFTSDQENAKSESGWNLSSNLPIPSSCLNSIDGGFSLHESGHNCDSGSCLCSYACGFHQPDSGAILSCLNCFIGTGSLYLYQYGVSKCMHFTRLRGGTCTIKPSDPPQDVIDRAVYLLGETMGFGDYNVVRNNCEDIALYCKTGLLIRGKPATGGSGQVKKKKKIFH
ncbi:protein LEAD-SENSITIVE 1-like [Bidens hawaiensis]|uniref:protein LEAD-SENSITIVE 1-like n=1 Tax=Bidens hawaiensis TaxID=980011 RepID=UPI00404AD08A